MSLKSLAERQKHMKTVILKLQQELQQLAEMEQNVKDVSKELAWNAHEGEGWLQAGKVLHAPEWQEPESLMPGARGVPNT